MVSFRHEVIIDTDEPVRRLQQRYGNLQREAATSGTVAPGTGLSGVHRGEKGGP